MADWPQFRGPSRDGISTETGLPSRLSAAPKRLWSAQVGEGYASVAISDGRAYTTGNVGGQDYVHCLDAATGKVRWQIKYPCGAGEYGGPRATPTVAGGRVYTFSREGLALCLDARSGRTLWRRDVARDAGATAPQWGFASSPLVHAGRAYYNAGGSGVALDVRTGRIAWKSNGGPAGYASVVAFDHRGKTALAVFAGTELVAVDPDNGRRLWAYEWRTSYDVNAADPIFAGTDAFISSNYGKGGARIQFGAGKPRQTWMSRSMKNHFNACVLVDGHLYGNDENTLRCLDWRTGVEKWAMRGMGKGGVIAADRKLIVVTERGELVLAATDPTRFRELGRVEVLSGTCWTQPALSDGRVYCRSHEGNLVCVALRNR